MEEIRLSYPVPYTAQVISPELAEAILSRQIPGESDPRWAESGAKTPSEYAYWTQRACGVACLKMCVDAFGGEPRSLVDWANAGLKINGYLVKTGANGQSEEIGWRHAALAALCHQQGLHAEALPATLAEIIAHLRADKLVIASVSYEIGTLGAVTKKGGHLVVVTGALLDDADAPTHIVINNPSGRYAHLRAGAVIPVERFAAAYTGRVITAWR